MKLLLLAGCLFLSTRFWAQGGRLPLKTWAGAQATPMVFYLSGDGGLNGFSTDLCSAINKSGYTISALDVRSYFWKQKTPAESAAAVAGFLRAALQNRPQAKLILVGYSFGADVLPFIAMRLPDDLKARLLQMVLISPSATTDFEVHLADIFAAAKKKAMDVPAELNKIGFVKTALLFGTDEDDFPLKRLTGSNHTVAFLPGGHHFDGDVTALSTLLLKYFRQ